VKKKINSWLFLIFNFMLFVILINFFSFTSFAIFEDSQISDLLNKPLLIERTASSDNYYLGDDSFQLISYANDVNLQDSNGNYQPFEDLVSLTYDENKLSLNWLNNSVDFNFYIKNNQDTKILLSELSSSEARDLNLRTNIFKGRGFYYFNHTLSRENQPSKFGYGIITNNVDCRSEGFSLICGKIKIDFSEAVNLQNLNVTITENSIEISGEDLSYIDPTVTLDRLSQTFVKKDEGEYYQQDTFVGFNGYTEYHRSWVDFNTSSIPDGSDITVVDFKFKTSYLVQDGCFGAGCTENFLKFYEFTVPCGSIGECWEAVDDATLYYIISNMEEDQWDDREETVDLGSSADADLESRLIDDDFGVGLVGYESGGSNDIYVRFTSSAGYSPSIAVTYMPPPDEAVPNTTISAVYSSNASISYTFGDTAMDYLTITLSCDDGDGDGCNITYYCIDTINSCMPSIIYSSPFENSLEGTTYIRYYSDDLASNSESTQYKTMIVDKSGAISIEEGINNALPSATIDDDLQLYLTYLNGSQLTGTFDKVVTYGNQRWAFNYIITNETYTNIENLAPSVYIWENDSLLSMEIKNQVEVLINSTLI